MSSGLNSELAFGYFYKQAPIVYLLIDPDQTIRDSNRFARELLGADPKGRAVSQVIEAFDDSLDDSLDVDRLALDPERVHRYNLHAAGLAQSFEFNFYPTAGGRVIALGKSAAQEFQHLQQKLIGVNQELNQLTRELFRQNAELKTLHQVKNDFLGMAAHDLRNPINAILAYCEFLLADSAGLSPAQLQMLESIKKDSGIMLGMLNELLDVARKQAGGPVTDAAPAQTVELPPPALSSLTGRILLAEDNPINQAVTEAILKKQGLEYRTVSTGREVLAALQQEHFDLILMDCQMPDMDGYEATRQIRRGETPCAAMIPIIALTGHTQLEAREQCLAAGMSDFLSKPFTTDQLASKLTHWLRPSLC